MPSWCIHFRVADWFLDRIPNLNKKYFLIGNIAPDCGVPVKNGYNPPTKTTHFSTNISLKSDCDYNYIFNEFIKNEKDKNKKSFYIGYFVHLMTDCQNAIYTTFPIEEKYGLIANNKRLSRRIKQEWHNIDFEFLSTNISPSFELFKTFDGFNESYPEWYKNGEISWQMKNIAAFYKDQKPKTINYKFTTPEDMNKFTSEVPEIIYNELISRGVQL